MSANAFTRPLRQVVSKLAKLQRIQILFLVAGLICILGGMVSVVYVANQNSTLPVSPKTAKPKDTSKPAPIAQAPSQQPPNATPSRKRSRVAPGSPPPPSDPHAITNPTLADCQKNDGTLRVYFFRYGGTNGESTTGQPLPQDSEHTTAFFPDRYRINTLPTTMNCVKDAAGSYVNGWLSYFGQHYFTYIAFKDVSLNEPAPIALTHTIPLGDLGVTIKVPETIEDLSFAITRGTLADGRPYIQASISTDQLTNRAADCAATGPLPGLGSIRRVEGSADPDSIFTIKQFPEFYIYNNDDPDTCNPPGDISLLQEGQQTDLFVALQSKDTITLQ